MLIKALLSAIFLSLWYDANWDWTPVFQLIGEHYYALDQKHINMYKLFVLRIITWSYNILRRIIFIIISYLKPCNIFQLTSDKSEYFKQYNFDQKNSAKK